MMSASVVTIPDRLSVQQAADSFFLPYHYTAFPMIDAGDVLLGRVTISLAEAVPAAERATTCIGDIADRDPTLMVAEDVDMADLVVRPGFRTQRTSGCGRPRGITDRDGFDHRCTALDSSAETEPTIQVTSFASGLGPTASALAPINELAPSASR